MLTTKNPGEINNFDRRFYVFTTMKRNQVRQFLDSQLQLSSRGRARETLDCNLDTVSEHFPSGWDETIKDALGIAPITYFMLESCSDVEQYKVIQEKVVRQLVEFTKSRECKSVLVTDASSSDGIVYVN